jgi:polysaccharide export outer membrane protein
MIRRIILFFIIGILVTSCNYYKKLTYLQGLPKSSDTTYLRASSIYKIQPADILYINVTSINPETVKPFNKDVVTSNYNASALPYIYGYSVSSNGYVELPVIGKFLVAGFTIDEVRGKLDSLLSVYLNDAIITVKLLSFKISILGEVKSPGQYTISNDRANIFEVISLAGDLNYYGNHKNILVLRQTTTGTRAIRVDLTDSNILTSDYYLLMPNIIYIEPTRRIGIKLAITDYAMVLTALTSTLTTLLLIYNLSK